MISRTSILITPLLFLIFTLPNHCLGQVEKLDSLRQQLEQEINDTTRVKLLNDIGFNMINSSLEESERYIQQAFELASKIDYQKGLARSFNHLAIIAAYRGQREEAFSNYFESLRIDSLINNLSGMASSYNNLGITFRYLGEKEKAIKYLQRSIELYTAAGDEQELSSPFNSLALVYEDFGWFSLALDYHLSSLELNKKYNQKAGISASLINIGNIYLHQSKLKESRESHLEALKISESIDHLQYQTGALSGLAATLKEEGKFSKAIEYQKQSLSIAEKMGKKYQLDDDYYLLGQLYYEINDKVRALDYLNEALRISKEMGNNAGLAKAEVALANINIADKQYNKAIERLQNASEHAFNSDEKIPLRAAYKGLSEAYEKSGDFRAALEYLNKYTLLNDSLAEQNSLRQLAELQTEYETTKKDQEIALQKAQLTTQESIIKQQSLERNLLIGGVVSAILILVLLIYIYNNRLKVKELVNKNQRDTEALRSSFFANISHEFRTPLTLISAPTQELMEKYGNKEDIATSLELISNNSKTLLRLINQLLDLSKLEAGKLELQVVKTNVVNWIGLVASSFESLASAKGIQYDILLPDESIDMYFDKEKVELILVNLLSNAFKFTTNGKKVEITASSYDDELSIAVRNEGNQIPKAYLNKIFDRFYQLPNQPATSGTGIGLALVKELTALHHGHVKLESTPDHTTFTITLPCNDESYRDDEIVDIPDQPSKEVVNEEVPLQENNETDNVSLEKTETILLVEDNDSLRSYLQGQLSKEYRVKVAENGQKGFSLATSEIPDLIITDVMMPEMDGNSLVQALRKDPKTNHIPIIMLTAKADKSSRLEGISHGTDHYLEKPFDMQELLVRIQSLIEQRNRIRSHYQHDFMLTPANETIVSADDEFVENLAKVMEEQLSNGEFTIELFASEMAMSRVQLLRKMKAIVGFSPSEFMKQYRLKKAHQYLSKNKGTVSEIAYAVGFNNLSYFTKAFKQQYSVNPSEVFRNSTDLVSP